MSTADAFRVAARRRAARRVDAFARTSAMRHAIGLLNEGRLLEAESMARRHMATHDEDPAALCLLGDLAARAGVHREAERLFRAALVHAPHFTEAELNLARILALRDGVAEAIDLLSEIVADEPGRVDLALTRLSLLGQIGEYGAAEAGYEELLHRHPDEARAWLGFAHLQKTLGRGSVSVAAYRRAIAITPTTGEAWWGLANLKTYPFSATDVEAMQAALGSRVLPRDAEPLHFALGKALELESPPERSFQHYAAGNRLRADRLRYDPDQTSEDVDRAISLFTIDFLKERLGTGYPSPEPIFILGLPRSGSTLIEQILASHPQVEGTSELPYIPVLAHRLLEETRAKPTLSFAGVLERLLPERLGELGQAYLDAAATHRRTDRPVFIDKLPNNWLYVGFIRLILPNARIIDARRSPIACCWSNFTQWFAQGQEFTDDLTWLGRYFRDYVRLMDHYDTVMPGTIVRVQHENLLADPEATIRCTLADLGLDFAPSCLRFHENDRPVRTASAEQVRQPLSPRIIDAWRRYEPWLGELKAALAGT